MVFRKDDAIGMRFMERVRGELIEDVALARSLVQEGRNVVLVDGARLLRVRMFEDFSSTVRGWGRSISLAGIESHSRLLGQLVAVACSQVLPIVFIISGSAPVMGSLLLAIRIGTLVGAASSYPQRKWSFWLSPVADVLAWSIVARGVIRHFVGAPVVWRGRTYGPSRSSL
jgi:dolichol-phosphate mannosyltransferase